jgi:hypothetical protein
MEQCRCSQLGLVCNDLCKEIERLEKEIKEIKLRSKGRNTTSEEHRRSRWK